MSITGERDGEPTKAGVALLDVVTGLYATVGILAALQERERTGAGRHVSVSLFDASVAAMVNQASNFLIGGVVPTPMGSQHPNIVPVPGVPRIGSAVHPGRRERSDLPANVRGRRTPRVGRRRALRHEPGPRRASRRARGAARRGVRRPDPPASWLAELEAASVPCSPIRAMDEVFAAPEGAALIETVEDPARGTTLRLVADPLRFDGERLPVRRPPPTLGRPRRRGARHVTALEDWSTALRAWTIPQAILEAAPESPFGFPPELFARRAASAAEPHRDHAYDPRRARGAARPRSGARRRCRWRRDVDPARRARRADHRRRRLGRASRPRSGAPPSTPASRPRPCSARGPRSPTTWARPTSWSAVTCSTTSGRWRRSSAPSTRTRVGGSCWS